MKATSVQQPWAQLIADRRRHILIKGWSARPGERLAIHASHVMNKRKCREFGYDPTLPLNAIIAIVEVRKCLDRGEARPSKFDVRKRPEAKQYAIVVRTVEKLRKPIPLELPFIHPAVWEWQPIGKTSASLPQETIPKKI